MDITGIVFDQVFKIIKGKLQERNVPTVPGTEASVANELTKVIAPVVLNQTNNEPLWKSRIMRGAVLALVGLGGGYFGLQIADGDLEAGLKAITDVVTAAGVLYSIYGRLTAKGTPKI